MYIKESINEIYKRIIKNVDSEIWWEVIKNDTSQGIDHTMTRVEDLYQKKHGNSKSKEGKPENKTKEVKILKAKEVLPENQMSKMIEMMENLTLLISNQSKTKFDPMKIKCFNCGQLGHATKFCNEPRNVENRMKNYSEMHKAKVEEEASPEAREKSHAPEERAMYISSDTNNNGCVFLSGQKRIRIEDITNNTLPAVPRTNQKNKLEIIGDKKKKPVQKLGQTSIIPSRILDGNAPISNKELFMIYPKYLKETIKALQIYEKSKNKNILYTNEVGHDSIAVNYKRQKLLSYIMCKINNQDIPLFIDSGSTSCVICK
ncbi:hypothetical protein AYI69_g1825 [Smittium culicis]|uniref:CCHC-type domain-containing protein n=1 Tax=Smittium culicis TaxID=133412 RepID=A0A1R1YP50_9FUNG|nr:hypothetical protein AYI69_g1825 [Smittium culicis]